MSHPVKNLIKVNGDISNLVKLARTYSLQQFDEEVVLSLQDIKNILDIFIRNELNSSQVTEWADAVEGIEIIVYNKKERTFISDIIFELSSPEINEAITKDKCIEISNKILVIKKKKCF